jgi:hypothetical protein
MITKLLKPGQLLIIKTDGTLEYVSPKEKKFSLRELQATVEMPEYGKDNLIELAPVMVKGHQVIVNESGLLLGMPLNTFAELALSGHKGHKIYVGNVVIVPNELWD